MDYGGGDAAGCDKLCHGSSGSGGIGSIRGSVIAAALLTVLPEMLRGLNDYRMLIYAIVLIVMMIFTRSPKLVAWRKEVAEKITEKFPILKLNKFLKDKSKKEAA